MPHKHKRRQNEKDTYDLPPTLIAKALPVRDPTKPSGKASFKGITKSKRSGNPNAKPKQKPRESQTAKSKTNPNAATRRKTALDDDDTPRAFRRLMQFHEKHQAGKIGNKRKRNGDDSSDDSGSDGDQPARSKKAAKKKTATAAQTKPEQSTESTEKTSAKAPKILPGEKLSDFAARVDREMPLSQMKRSDNPTATGDNPKVNDHKRTKHEKHLRRLQKQWREDDVKIREREAAQREEREEEMEEQLQLWKTWEIEAGKKKRNPNASVGASKKKKNAGGQGGVDDDGPDPWAKLKKKRAAVNPFDVAQEPPQLQKPKEKFKVRGGAKVDIANVPATVGSLRRREELASERRNIVEEYRRLMAERRQ
ncbi:hypothetical protein BJX99DRAFT_224048 [Aspergillus californicus]